ncbi:hypothetical protein DMB38_12960 [Streptomyces sp. WAC 06738]|uniref:hypothetical protein n=1 Tax=Streptomyces sp. WAC 06738 TaxID=2203210 RepID=UPI000F6F17BB|nr:hypothetical protein [Streptomyces sp. WAC 06738]AZM46604.1 hypothetical protein DMB38_12960 [Streptomyces sp. WAC 06738]
MSTRPYTTADLRAEAAGQHATATADPDFMGIGEQMLGALIPSTVTDPDASATSRDGGRTWDMLARDDFEAALSTEQRRGLFEQPGRVVVAIVELTSKQYTGHADGEEKAPEVKLRVTGCEVGRSDDEAASLLDAKRAMWRARRMDGTLDEIGQGTRDAEAVLDGAFGGYPTEAEYKKHAREQEERRRAEFVR